MNVKKQKRGGLLIVDNYSRYSIACAIEVG